MEILAKENLVRAKTAPTAVSRTFNHLVKETGFLRKDSLLPQKIRWKINRHWGVGVESGSREQEECEDHSHHSTLLVQKQKR